MTETAASQDMIFAEADDGARLACRTDGRADAPVVILAHALGVDHRIWDAQVADLAGRFRLIRYDGRGHGRSDAPPGDYSIERLGRDALAVMDAFALNRAAFCGLSLGGMVGQWLGAHAGDRVERLVLANTSPYAGPEIWGPRVAAARRDGMAGMVETTLERWFTEGFRERSPQAVDRIRRILAATPAEGYASCAAAIRDMDQRDSIRRIAAPTLVIYGRADVATPPDKAREMHEAIAGSELLELAAAHLSNVEQPQAFSEALAGFLSRA